MSVFTIFHFHSIRLFTKKNSIIMISLLLIYCLITLVIYGVGKNTSDALSNVFSNSRIPIVDLCRSLLLILSFSSTLNYFFQEDVRKASSHVLLRIQNKAVYFHAALIMLIFFIFIFISIGYMIAFVLIQILHFVGEASNPLFLNEIMGVIICKQFFILMLSMIALVLLQLIFMLLIESEEVSTLFFILLIIASFIYINLHPNNYIYIPFLYGFFNDYQHLTSNMYLLETFILLVFIGVLYGSSYLIFRRKKDFFRK